MPKILLVGEHPFSGTGNGNMMAALIATIDRSEYEITVFANGDPSPDLIFSCVPDYTIIDSSVAGDPWGAKKLVTMVAIARPDLVFFVGVDVWRYQNAYQDLLGLAVKQGFKMAILAPYDLPVLRYDWLSIFSVFDRVLIYSQYGYEMVNRQLNNAAYFRPPLHNKEKFKCSPAVREQYRKFMFPNLKEDAILVGFVGHNQFRKDPMTHLEGFALARRHNPSLALYLHTDMQGVFNIPQICSDLGLGAGVVYAKDPKLPSYPIDRMVAIYNSLDMLLMCSAYEGLSWTPLEAMLCGTPVIASKSTAHMELIGSAGILVPCEQPYMVPIPTKLGHGFTRCTKCSAEEIASAILTMTDSNFRNKCVAMGVQQAEQWLDGVMDINPVLNDILSSRTPIGKEKIDAILFAQYASAGDVLMTTQCFKGLKEKHPGKRLVYMTQHRFMDILKGNPYIDELIDWNPTLLRRYSIVYNPHGDKIVTGGFNSLDTTLYEMYPYFCGHLTADVMAIMQEKPKFLLPDTYAVVQSAGGDKQYRTYSRMDEVCAAIKMPIVQIGGYDDPMCPSATLDLRGKLSFTESAYVVGHAAAGVVIDSFPAHLCGALGTPAVVLYGPAPARITHPRDDHNVIINLEPNRLEACPVLTTCWGAPGKRPCQTPCINTIEPAQVIAAFEQLL